MRQDQTGVFQDKGFGGVPLPIFVNKKTKEILVDDEVIENIASIMKKRF